MPVAHKACVLLTEDAERALVDMKHLMDTSLYGPLFCCQSAIVKDGFVKMAVKCGRNPIDVQLPERYVRAIFALEDLVRLEIYGERDLPAPLTSQQLLDGIRKEIAKQGAPAGAEVPAPIFRSIYATTPAALVDGALETLVGEGLFRRDDKGKLYVAG